MMPESDDPLPSPFSRFLMIWHARLQFLNKAYRVYLQQETPVYEKLRQLLQLVGSLGLNDSDSMKV